MVIPDSDQDVRKRGRLLFIQHSSSATPGALAFHATHLGYEVASARADLGLSDVDEPKAFSGLVVMGSLGSVTDSTLAWLDAERRYVERAIEADVSVLGICFGAQLLAQALGGQVRRAPQPEVGWLEVETTQPDRIPPGPWFVWHEDTITPPLGATVVAHTDSAIHAFVTGHHTGVQFHPEVTPRLIHRWLNEAAEAHLLTADRRRDLLQGVALYARRSRRQARRLLESHLEQATSVQ